MLKATKRPHNRNLSKEGVILILILDVNKYKELINQVLKGQCHEIFCFRFFSYIIFLQAPENDTRVISNFSKIRGDIRKSRCTTGINNTGGKSRAGGKLIHVKNLKSKISRTCPFKWLQCLQVYAFLKTLNGALPLRYCIVYSSENDYIEENPGYFPQSSPPPPPDTQYP
jgi:hypothetical protein